MYPFGRSDFGLENVFDWFESSVGDAATNMKAVSQLASNHGLEYMQFCDFGHSSTDFSWMYARRIFDRVF